MRFRRFGNVPDCRGGGMGTALTLSFVQLRTQVKARCAFCARGDLGKLKTLVIKKQGLYL